MQWNLNPCHHIALRNLVDKAVIFFADGKPAGSGHRYCTWEDFSQAMGTTPERIFELTWALIERGFLKPRTFPMLYPNVIWSWNEQRYPDEILKVLGVE